MIGILLNIGDNIIDDPPQVVGVNPDGGILPFQSGAFHPNSHTVQLRAQVRKVIVQQIFCTCGRFEGAGRFAVRQKEFKQLVGQVFNLQGFLNGLLDIGGGGVRDGSVHFPADFRERTTSLSSSTINTLILSTLYFLGME